MRRKAGLTWRAAGLLTTGLVSACTTLGCGRGVYLLTSEAAELAGADRFEIEVCVDGECESWQVASAAESESYLSFTSGRNDSGPAQIQITTEANGVVNTASGTVDLDTFRPNGFLSPPVCAVVDITINDSAVTNAAPGTFPPMRDRF